MDDKLGTIIQGQANTQRQLSSLRETILARLDESDQTVVANVIIHLDQNQLEVTGAMLNALGENRAADETWQELLTAVQQTLTELQQHPPSQLDTNVAHDIQQVAGVIAEPRFDVRHKLKVAAPIIPFILWYEGELELNSSMNLESAWRRFMARLRGDRE